MPQTSRNARGVTASLASAAKPRRLNKIPVYRANRLVLIELDGAAGEKYQATSLPQIVVIDTEMKVADLIIGTNPGFIDQLRASIQKSLEPKKPK